MTAYSAQWHKLVLFDLDGTLIESYMDAPDRRAAYGDPRLLPGAQAAVDDVLANGAQVGIVTNQAGVAFGHFTEREALSRIRRVCRLLDEDRDRFTSWWIYACFHHPDAPDARWTDRPGCARRKPSGQMLNEAWRDADVSPTSTLFVGDQETDQVAARRAGVNFCWAQEFLVPYALKAR